jgi:hypothetical protein
VFRVQGLRGGRNRIEPSESWRRASFTLSVGTPICPYGIAYRRISGLSFRWTVPFSLGSGCIPDRAFGIPEEGGEVSGYGGIASSLKVLKAMLVPSKVSDPATWVRDLGPVGPLWGGGRNRMEPSESWRSADRARRTCELTTLSESF